MPSQKPAHLVACILHHEQSSLLVLLAHAIRLVEQPKAHVLIRLLLLRLLLSGRSLGLSSRRSTTSSWGR